MAEEINDLDSMDDEAFLEAIQNATDEPIGGGEEQDAEEQDGTEPEVTDEDDESLEDTEQQNDEDEDEVDDAETNDQIDGDDDETEVDETEESEDDEAENSQEDVEDSLDEDEADAGSEEDETDTKDGSDGENQDTEEIDYKAEYEAIKKARDELQAFKDEITSEFVVDGRKVRGFDDPKLIIQSQQMSGNYGNKLAALKPYRPFMKPLKERGYTDDPEKFNFLMQIDDGDVDAIKKHLKDKGIDPFELDMENVDVKQKQYVSSDMDVAVDELFESAERYGVDQKLQTALKRDWDESSLSELIGNETYRNDIVRHMSDGSYDIIQDRIFDIKRSDVSGRFSSMSKIDQYKTAVKSIQQERQEQYKRDQSSVENIENQSENVEKQVATKHKDDEVKEEYKAKVEKKASAEANKRAEKARNKASSVSKRRTGKKKVTEKFDPDSLSDEEFEKMINNFKYNS